MMDKKQRQINRIKCWLHKHGERDNECFTYWNDDFSLMLRYDYDKNGKEWGELMDLHFDDKMDFRSIYRYDIDEIKKVADFLFKVKNII